MNRKISQLSRFFILILALLMAALPTMQASARLRTCRTDPIFHLSNGDKITITLDVGTDELSVKNVSYVLHVPAGVTITKVVFTAGGLGQKETYQALQDSPAKTYTTDSLATTQQVSGGTTVKATTKLNTNIVKSVSGYNGQHLIVTVTKP